MTLLAAKQPARELAGKIDDQKRTLRNFCADNPLRNYMDGVLDLFGKLRFLDGK
ncbi:hypothetical protein [Tardiphaga sp. vice352]|uniref:hypothetical protein n=1 Tax=Tardiphaga sp. vice352 TaxID=2592816 RepID=UPI00143CD785|nr:hypothetical protein [Tardiphaga sp. vice352]